MEFSEATSVRIVTPRCDGSADITRRSDVSTRGKAVQPQLGLSAVCLAFVEGLVGDLKDNLIKIGAKMVSHGRYIIFQMEVAITANVPRDFAAHRRATAAATTRASVRGCHAFKSNRQKECVQMPGKMARSDPRPAFGLPEVLVAVSTSRLSCKRAGKTRTLMPVWDSSGESRIEIGGAAIASRMSGGEKRNGWCP